MDATARSDAVCLRGSAGGRERVESLRSAGLGGDPSLVRVLQVVKSASARRANRILGRTGQRFWQEESFDRWVRDRNEEGRIARYIDSNSLAAGLARAVGDWPWSSAYSAGAWLRPTWLARHFSIWLRQTTTCRGYLSEEDTPSSPKAREPESTSGRPPGHRRRIRPQHR